LPDAVRYCRVELAPEQSVYIPLLSTNLHPAPPRPPTVLTPDAIAALVAAFRTLPVALRSKRATRHRS
jgi:hypothetical protein